MLCCCSSIAKLLEEPLNFASFKNLFAASFNDFAYRTQKSTKSIYTFSKLLRKTNIYIKQQRKKQSAYTLIFRGYGVLPGRSLQKNMLRNQNKESFKHCCIYRQERYIIKTKYIEKHQKVARLSRSIGRLNSANATFTTKD